MQTEFNLDKMMPAGREAEAPKVVTEGIDVLEAWRPRSEAGAPPLGKANRVGSAPAQDTAGPGAGAARDSRDPADSVDSVDATRTGGAAAGSASADAFAAAPSATTERGYGDDDDDDQETAAASGAAATGPLLTRSRFFFPRSVSSLRGESTAVMGEEGHAAAAATASPAPVVAGADAGAGGAADAAVAGPERAAARGGAAVSIVAGPASVDAFATAPSATTEHGNHGDDPEVPPTAGGGAATGPLPATRGRFFFPKSARSARSTDLPFAAGDRSSPGAVGERTTATAAVAAAVAALGKPAAGGRGKAYAYSNPSFSKEEAERWFDGRRASAPSAATTITAGAEDDKDVESQLSRWASTGGGAGGGRGGGGLGATVEEGGSRKRAVSPRALSVFGLADTLRASSTLVDAGGGVGSGSAGGGGPGGGDESAGRRKRSQKGNAAARWFGNVLKSASSIGATSLDGGGVDAFDDDDDDDDDASDDFETDDDREGVKVRARGKEKELLDEEARGARGRGPGASRSAGEQGAAGAQVSIAHRNRSHRRRWRRFGSCVAVYAYLTTGGDGRYCCCTERVSF